MLTVLVERSPGYIAAYTRRSVSTNKARVMSCFDLAAGSQQNRQGVIISLAAHLEPPTPLCPGDNLSRENLLATVFPLSKMTIT